VGWVEMLRITVVESSSEAVKLRVEGRVTDRWVEELRRSCDVHALYDGIRLTLDLADVSFVDTAGIEFLKELRSRCVTLLSPSPFVAEQLKGVASCDDSRRLDR
jgi:anti-anti-sigma regulatory factor